MQINLSAADEIDPENETFKTPQKRQAKVLRSKSVARKSKAKVDDADDHIGAKLSSTKIMKIEKLE
jgi:hypothetical protein